MAIERKFIQDNIKKLEVKEYLMRELDRAGCGEIDIQRTPQGTRVIVNAQRPGLVIGRKGASIRKLTNILSKKYGIDNPQIEVNELQVPELNAQVMAKNIASSLERGVHFRRAAYTALRRIMEAGARGAQIEISGKLTGERAKSVKFTDGYLKRCGDPAFMFVREGVAQASPKPGVLGVKVKIMPPGVVLPDDVEFIGEEVREKKPAEVKEEIEELVEGIEEELVEIVESEEEAPKAKKLKPEKVKRKAKKKPKEEEESGDTEE
jgi:small subunit ribosomal protein S3